MLFPCPCAAVSLIYPRAASSTATRARGTRRAWGRGSRPLLTASCNPRTRSARSMPGVGGVGDLALSLLHNAHCCPFLRRSEMYRIQATKLCGFSMRVPGRAVAGPCRAAGLEARRHLENLGPAQGRFAASADSLGSLLAHTSGACARAAMMGARAANAHTRMLCVSLCRHHLTYATHMGFSGL